MHIFLDFDGTITVNDTIGQLAQFALDTQRDTHNRDLKESWDGVVAAYVDEYKRHVEDYHPPETDRREPAQEVRFLRAAKDVELRSLARINACGVFRGISEDEFKRAGRKAVEDGIVKVRDGFEVFLRTVLEEGHQVFVISVNWSTAFIEGVLDCSEVEVIANHVQDDGTVVGPRIFLDGAGGRPNLTNSLDKLRAMTTVCERDGHYGRYSWYFGDSITDLECLLHASVGIVISDKEDSNLLGTLRRIGKDVPQIKDWKPSGGKHEEVELSYGSRDFAWVSGYDGIAERIIAYARFNAQEK